MDEIKHNTWLLRVIASVRHHNTLMTHRTYTIREEVVDLIFIY